MLHFHVVVVIKMCMFLYLKLKWICIVLTTWEGQKETCALLTLGGRMQNGHSKLPCLPCTTRKPHTTGFPFSPFTPTMQFPPCFPSMSPYCMSHSSLGQMGSGLAQGPGPELKLSHCLPWAGTEIWTFFSLPHVDLGGNLVLDSS